MGDKGGARIGELEKTLCRPSKFVANVVVWLRNHFTEYTKFDFCKTHKKAHFTRFTYVLVIDFLYDSTTWNQFITLSE